MVGWLKRRGGGGGAAVEAASAAFTLSDGNSRRGSIIAPRAAASSDLIFPLLKLCGIAMQLQIIAMPPCAFIDIRAMHE